jgi:hypothetical protein
MPQIACLRCKTTMEQGFITDTTYGGIVQETWVTGAPETSFWGSLKVRGKERLPVSTYRCPTCGYLESYANSPGSDWSSTRP